MQCGEKTVIEITLPTVNIHRLQILPAADTSLLSVFVNIKYSHLSSCGYKCADANEWMKYECRLFDVQHQNLHKPIHYFEDQ